MTCRKRIDDVETGVVRNWALAGNLGTCRPDAKGEVQAGGPREDWSTNAGHRGGAARSREEGSVMELDRRGCVVQLWPGGNRPTGPISDRPEDGLWEEPRG